MAGRQLELCDGALGPRGGGFVARFCGCWFGKIASICDDIVEELPLARSTVSQDLGMLKDAGLIRGGGGRAAGLLVHWSRMPLRRLRALVGGSDARLLLPINIVHRR